MVLYTPPEQETLSPITFHSSHTSSSNGFIRLHIGQACGWLQPDTLNSFISSSLVTIRPCPDRAREGLYAMTATQRFSISYDTYVMTMMRWQERGLTQAQVVFMKMGKERHKAETKHPRLQDLLHYFIRSQYLSSVWNKHQKVETNHPRLQDPLHYFIRSLYLSSVS